MKHKPKKNRHYYHDDDDIGVDKEQSHRRERREFSPHRIKQVWERIEPQHDNDDADE